MYGRLWRRYHPGLYARILPLDELGNGRRRGGLRLPRLLFLNRQSQPLAVFLEMRMNETGHLMPLSSVFNFPVEILHGSGLQASSRRLWGNERGQGQLCFLNHILQFVLQSDPVLFVLKQSERLRYLFYFVGTTVR